MGEPPYRAVAIWKFRYFELRDARRLPTEPVTKNDTADLKRGERKGRTVAASAHNAEDNPGTLRANGFGRPTESSQQGVQMVLPMSFSEKLKARSATAPA